MRISANCGVSRLGSWEGGPALQPRHQPVHLLVLAVASAFTHGHSAHPLTKSWCPKCDICSVRNGGGLYFLLCWSLKSPKSQTECHSLKNAVLKTVRWPFQLWAPAAKWPQWGFSFPFFQAIKYSLITIKTSGQERMCSRWQQIFIF